MERVDSSPLDEGGARVLCSAQICRYRHSGHYYAVIDFLDGLPPVQTASFDTLGGLQIAVGNMTIDRKVRGA